MNAKTIPIENYVEYVQMVNEIRYKEWVYRGHSRVNWRIESSLARHYRTHRSKFTEKTQDTRETDAIRKFRRAAHQYLQHLPERDDLRSWLAVMQHFGAPTRLIDFTFSPLVGLYFAAVDSVSPIGFGEAFSGPDLENKYNRFQVHAINVGAVRELARQRGKNVGVKIRLNPEESQYKIGNGQAQEADFVGFFEGAWQNPRQTAQQGLFMITSKVMMNVHRFLESITSTPDPFDNPWLIFEFKGGQDMYNEMVTNLISANLTAASLFPGIEGLARSMYLRMFEGAKQLD